MDLQDIITDFRPAHIFTTIQFDSHGDHSTTHNLLALALAAVSPNLPGYTPTIHKTFVHAGVEGWPSPIDPNSYFSEVPNLAQYGLIWSERESIDVPFTMQSSYYPSNPKYQAIDEHASQGGVTGFLGSFIHKDEFFWVENLLSNNGPPHIDAGLDQTVSEGSLVDLNGTGSSDPNGDPLTYHWVQVAGSSVQLSNPNIPNPYFTAPSGLTSDEVLTLELTVSDGQLSSIPDSVNITVLSSGPPNSNIAPLAAVTASSETPYYGQLAVKAVDGFIDGWPGDYTREWATSGEGGGAWIRLNWSTAYEVDRIVLYDRPNLNEQIVSGTITFSDGSTLQVGPLNNNGTATEYRFAAKTITSLTLTVNSVSSATWNIGLAEIEVYGSISQPGNRAPVANAGPDQTVAEGSSVTLNGSGSSDPDGNTLTYQWTQTAGLSVQLSNPNAVNPTFTAPTGLTADQVLTFELVVNDGQLNSPADYVNITARAAVNHAPVANAGPDQTVAEGSSVILNGSGSSDPDGNTLTYQWTQTAGLSVQLSNPNAVNPTFTAPTGLTGDQVLTFKLVVNDGLLNSTPDSVNITVLAANPPGSNIAALATVTASSETPYYGQLAIKAVDGFIDGWPGDYTREWATRGEGAGAWMRLNWSTAYEVGRIVLYDRPNLDDQIISGTITFSDGSTLQVGPLNNNGTATEYRFAAKTITSLTLTVNSVSSATLNIGLAEIEVYGSATQPGNRAPVANAGPDQTVSEGSLVNLSGSGSSDPDGDPLTYHWVQTAGLSVQLSDPNVVNPSFTAPSGLTADQVLTFELVVNDGQLNSPADYVNITVRAAVNHAPVANAGPDQTVAEGSSVTLNGSGSSDPDGNTLTYQWTQTAGLSVQLSNPNAVNPTFTAPTGLTGDQVLTFELVVNDGLLNSTPDSVNITVLAANPPGSNIAALATVTASSETPYYGQLAIKAVDGFIDGWPGDYTREWATNGERAGAWIRLNWSSAYIVNRIVLYDRPNLNDQIVAGTITFSDGSTLSVGPLNNNGIATEYRFAAKTITSLTLTVNTVGSATDNIGLAEIEVYGTH